MTQIATLDTARPLTAKQQSFIAEYLVDLNATQAAIRAGYSENTAAAIGSENLTKAWSRIRGKVGVSCRLHDLRHAHATTLIEAGVHIKAV